MRTRAPPPAPNAAPWRTEYQRQFTWKVEPATRVQQASELQRPVANAFFETSTRNYDTTGIDPYSYPDQFYHEPRQPPRQQWQQQDHQQFVRDQSGPPEQPQSWSKREQQQYVQRQRRQKLQEFQQELQQSKQQQYSGQHIQQQQAVGSGGWVNRSNEEYPASGESIQENERPRSSRYEEQDVEDQYAYVERPKTPSGRDRETVSHDQSRVQLRHPPPRSPSLSEARLNDRPSAKFEQPASRERSLERAGNNSHFGAPQQQQQQQHHSSRDHTENYSGSNHGSRPPTPPTTGFSQSSRSGFQGPQHQQQQSQRPTVKFASDVYNGPGQSREILPYGHGNTNPPNDGNYMKTFNVKAPQSQVPVYPNTARFYRAKVNQPEETSRANRPVETTQAFRAFLDAKKKSRTATAAAGGFQTEYQREFLDWTRSMMLIGTANKTGAAVPPSMATDGGRSNGWNAGPRDTRPQSWVRGDGAAAAEQDDRVRSRGLDATDGFEDGSPVAAGISERDANRIDRERKHFSAGPDFASPQQRPGTAGPERYVETRQPASPRLGATASPRMGAVSPRMASASPRQTAAQPVQARRIFIDEDGSAVEPESSTDDDRSFRQETVRGERHGSPVRSSASRIVTYKAGPPTTWRLAQDLLRRASERRK